MMSSATSTERTSARSVPAAQPAPFRAWHFFILLAMLGATIAVVLARDTHPVALLLLTAAVVCAGLVGVAIHGAVSGFFARGDMPEPLRVSLREELEREKALVLRSLKELEFDKKMGKVSDDDYGDISGRLRARALALMADLDRIPSQQADDRPSDIVPGPSEGSPVHGRPGTDGTPGRTRDDVHGTTCPSCGTRNDPDARFCKQCGAGVARTGASA
jgi:hypothetical protein